MYNYSLDPCGPVYITVGDGGNIEKVDMDHADEPGKCPSPGDNVPEIGGVCHMNFSSGPAKGKFCWETQPEWSAYRESSFGHGILEVYGFGIYKLKEFAYVLPHIYNAYSQFYCWHLLFELYCMQIMNSTYALWTWHRNQDIYKEVESPGDQIFIVRQTQLCSSSPTSLTRLSI